MPKRKQKKYNRPKKLYDKPRIEEENQLVKKYGLKNKTEIWRADFAIGKIRDLAKKLIAASDEEKQEFISKQQAKGLDVSNIADVLGLDKEDYLKRRLQSVLVSKGIVKTPRQARQFITHRHVTVNGNIINSPGHLTTIDEEGNIELKISLPVVKDLTKQEKDVLAEIKEAAKETTEAKQEENKEEVKEEGEDKEEIKVEEKK